MHTVILLLFYIYPLQNYYLPYEYSSYQNVIDIFTETFDKNENVKKELTNNNLSYDHVHLTKNIINLINSKKA